MKKNTNIKTTYHLFFQQDERTRRFHITTYRSPFSSKNNDFCSLILPAHALRLSVAEVTEKPLFTSIISTCTGWLLVYPLLVWLQATYSLPFLKASMFGSGLPSPPSAYDDSLIVSRTAIVDGLNTSILPALNKVIYPLLLFSITAAIGLEAPPVW